MCMGWRNILRVVCWMFSIVVECVRMSLEMRRCRLQAVSVRMKSGRYRLDVVVMEVMRRRRMEAGGGGMEVGRRH